MRGILRLLMVLPLFAPHPILADDLLPPGPFAETECIDCHNESDPELIRQWREGPHSSASGSGCSGCHGDRHTGSAATAREDQICTGCHEGPASHSYATSKHGIITRLAERRQDWQQPLQRGNYRSPGCSYCHLHDRDHGDTMASSQGPEVRHWICSGCHSPRYVREQFASGKRQLGIADLKLSEGETLIFSTNELEPDMLLSLRQDLIRHRQNVLLGVGHQSPDYQWWHGQPAMDGDLIRIRDAINTVNRTESDARNTTSIEKD